MEDGESLAEYVLPKGLKLNPEVQTTQVQKLRQTEYFTQEPGNFENWRQEANKIGNAQISWIQETLGLNVSDRLATTLRKIKFFDPEAWKAYGEKHDKKGSAGGHAGIFNEALIDVSKPYPAVVHTIGHEILHGAQLEVVNFVAAPTESDQQPPEPNYKPQALLSGYENERLKSLMSINEAVTELMNVEFFEWCRQQPELGIQVPENFVGHSGIVLLVDSLTEQIATKIGRPVKEINHSLYRGAIRGDFRKLRIFEEVLGKGILKVIGGIKSGTPMEPVVKQLSEVYGFNTAAFYQKFDDYLSGQTVQILGGTEVNIYNQF